MAIYIPLGPSGSVIAAFAITFSCSGNMYNSKDAINSEYSKSFSIAGKDCVHMKEAKSSVKV